jgi:hypothetical protein
MLALHGRSAPQSATALTAHHSASGGVNFPRWSGSRFADFALPIVVDVVNPDVDNNSGPQGRRLAGSLTWAGWKFFSQPTLNFSSQPTLRTANVGRKGTGKGEEGDSGSNGVYGCSCFDSHPQFHRLHRLRPAYGACNTRFAPYFRSMLLKRSNSVRAQVWLKWLNHLPRDLVLLSRFRF